MGRSRHDLEPRLEPGGAGSPGRSTSGGLGDAARSGPSSTSSSRQRIDGHWAWRDNPRLASEIVEDAGDVAGQRSAVIAAIGMWRRPRRKDSASPLGSGDVIDLLGALA